MGFFGKVVLSVALVLLLFGGLTIFAGQTGINAMIGHFSAVFDFIAGNLNNLHEIFPAYDLVIAVGCIFSIEALILLYKFGRWMMSFFKH